MLTSRDDTGSIVRKPSGKASEVPVFVSCHPATTAHNIFYITIYFIMLFYYYLNQCYVFKSWQENSKLREKENGFQHHTCHNDYI